MNPAYTAALCTHNHADRLKRTLADLANLRAPAAPWELVVVDNASKDQTAIILASHTWPSGWSVRVVREENLGLSNARNRVLDEAGGDYIIFFDDDETLDPDWLLAYEREILGHQPDALGGRIEVLFEEDSRPPWLTDELLGFLGRLNHGVAPKWLTENQTPFFGGNFACHRRVFETVGRFDTQLGRKGADNTGGEDTDLYRRLIAGGMRVRWVPEAVIHHRIQPGKLKRSYFLDLHYRQGRVEGLRNRGNHRRIPPAYLLGQFGRAVRTALNAWCAVGRNASLRKEMNAAYFAGYIFGWVSGKP